MEEKQSSGLSEKPSWKEKKNTRQAVFRAQELQSWEPPVHRQIMVARLKRDRDLLRLCASFIKILTPLTPFNAFITSIQDRLKV